MMPIKLDRDALMNASRYSALGFEVAGAIVGGLLLGSYVDSLIGTGPLFLIACSLGGLYGAVRVLLWSLKKSSR